MAKNEKAVAVLSAGISFFVMNSTINAMLKLSGKILADGTYAKSVLNGQITSVCGIDSLQMGVFAGVIVGLVTAALHNRFYKQQLPAALAFFSNNFSLYGQRFRVESLHLVIWLCILDILEQQSLDS